MKSAVCTEWKKRFFVLDGDKITYYTKEDCENKKGDILLPPGIKMQVVKSKKVGSPYSSWIEIYAANRVWMLAAENERENIAWLDQLVQQQRSMQKVPEVLVMGPPGCGKTTQCHELANSTGAQLIRLILMHCLIWFYDLIILVFGLCSPGDVLRKHIKLGSKLGQKARQSVSVNILSNCYCAVSITCGFISAEIKGGVRRIDGTDVSTRAAQ